MNKSLASPATRQLAREANVDLASLAQELGQEHLSRADVEHKRKGSASINSGNSSAWDINHSRYGPVEAVELSRLNQLAAANLSAAQQFIPAVTHHDRAEMAALEDFRKSLKADAESRGVRLTSLPFHIRALVSVLKTFPRFNASLSADASTLWLKKYFDISIAVDTPHGLMVPVIRGADRKTIWQLATEIADLAERAQSRKLRPEEMGGASMTITNLGGIGGRAFTPIVNPPEVAILGLTRAAIEPIWDGNGFQPCLMCPLDLSYDHRVINGAEAARFLAHYARLLADPRRLLL